MLLRKSRVAIVILAGVLAAPFVKPDRADAIPAFSRQHKTECSTCHTVYPELNEFGEAFLKNNYVYPGKKGAAKTAEGKDSKSEWAWLSGLPEMIPVSFTATIDAAYDRDAFDGNELDLSSRSLRLQAGGTFRDAAAFFATYNLYTQGAQTGPVANNPTVNANTPPNNNPNISELFLIWREAFGTPVNVKVGRMEPNVSLWKRSNKVIVVPPFASTSYLVGNSPFSVDAPEDALEINGVLGNRLFFAGGVVDRNGQNQNDGYGRLALKIGGTDYKGEEPEIDLDNESVWDYLAITLGAYGYKGRNGDFDQIGIARNMNSFYRAGAEIDILYKRLHLKGSGSFGRDANPLFLATPSALETHAVSAEGEYYLGAPINLVPLFRYDFQEGVDGATRRYIPAIAYTPLQNTKLTLEYIFTDAPTGINRTALASLAFSL
ncbi:cytochrome C [Geomonas sp. Red32]|uniref:cytochrome C n=1 Tax=Geomonas sp. Red32 TaxID=2912856 RepID=UPI00202CF5B5|nr:cytochrome C [Geomonas sp. Red32]MCM0082514.1 cytochrome C [Geomonas sp. Red32]